MFLQMDWQPPVKLSGMKKLSGGLWMDYNTTVQKVVTITNKYVFLYKNKWFLLFFACFWIVFTQKQMFFLVFWLFWNCFYTKTNVFSSFLMFFELFLYKNNWFFWFLMVFQTMGWPRSDSHSLGKPIKNQQKTFAFV